MNQNFQSTEVRGKRPIGVVAHMFATWVDGGTSNRVRKHVEQGPTSARADLIEYYFSWCVLYTVTDSWFGDGAVLG